MYACDDPNAGNAGSPAAAGVPARTKLVQQRIVAADKAASSGMEGGCARRA
jgi:hypothetical protein